MRPIMSMLSHTLACGLFLAILLASHQATAQCYTDPSGRTFCPLKKAAAVVGKTANTVGAVIQAQPIRSTIQAFAEHQPIRTGLRTAFGVQTNYVQSADCNCGCNQVGCQCGIPSHGSSFEVGGRDSDGALITSIGSYPTQASTNSVGSLSFASRRSSREAILAAAKKAHDDCTINSDELRAIKIACMSPRMLARMEDLIVEKAQSSGAYSFALKNGEVDKSAIDWEAIGDFILKIAPLIFKLIEMFAYDTSPSAEAMYASSVDHSLNFVATHMLTAC